MGESAVIIQIRFNRNRGYKITANADGTDSLMIDTDDPVLISIKHPFVCTECLERQLVLSDGWIECYWHKPSGFITGLEIIPGDPLRKDDLQPMDWIQTRDPRKQ